MKTSIAIFFGFTIIFTNILHADMAQQQLVQVASNGKTVIACQSAGAKVKITIGTHEIDIGNPSDRRPETIQSNCTYSKFPCSTVDYINILINDKPIFIPRSLFCDLADLNTAEIKTEQELNNLILIGGDASESYIVKIRFDKQRVKSRSFASLMMPNAPLQETIYYVQTVGE